MSVAVSVACEGQLDAAVAQALASAAGARAGPLSICGGKARLLQRLPSYGHAARGAPWLVLIDLDQDAPCAPTALGRWLPRHAAPGLCLRIAVREVEAWLMGDAEQLATFLCVPLRWIPTAPESLPDPKGELVSLARRSRSRSVREALVPDPRGGRRVGAGYTPLMIDYVHSMWRPDVAAQACDSLARALRCLRRLARLARLARQPAAGA